MRRLVGLPVGRTRGSWITRLAGLPSLLPGGLEVRLLRLALDLVGPGGPGDPVVPRRRSRLSAVDRLQQPTAAAIAASSFTMWW